MSESNDTQNHVQADWEAYFTLNIGRRVHPDFLRAYEQVSATHHPVAVDLGAGDGTESAFLISKGWKVYAFDLTPGLHERISAKLGHDPGASLVAVDSAFGEIAELPRATLVYAGMSLPFATTAELSHIIGLSHASLQPEGVFAGHFLGENDSWHIRPDVQTHALSDLQGLLATFSDVAIDDREYDAGSGTGPKHWHVRWVEAKNWSQHILQ